MVQRLRGAWGWPHAPPERSGQLVTSPIEPTRPAPSPAAHALGIGLLYNNALPAFIREHIDAVDYVSFIPDTSWMDHGPGASPRYEVFEQWEETLSWIAARRPMISHN